VLWNSAMVRAVVAIPMVLTFLSEVSSLVSTLAAWWRAHDRQNWRETVEKGDAPGRSLPLIMIMKMHCEPYTICPNSASELCLPYWRRDDSARVLRRTRINLSNCQTVFTVHASRFTVLLFSDIKRRPFPFATEHVFPGNVRHRCSVEKISMIFVNRWALSCNVRLKM